MNEISMKELSHTYQFEGGYTHSLTGITLNVQKGEFVSLLGPNGSGKSTILKQINILYPIQKGTLTVAGFDASKPANVSDIRKHCGLVFQNPDNQFVSTILEEDIAFGLENYDYPDEAIPQRVKEALEMVDMAGYEKKSPHMLSGGQKQRIALAGVLAINPEILLFDEVTSMLDPQGRKEILAMIQKLHVEYHKTILMVTHNVEETLLSDRIVVIHQGKILAQGLPREILTDTNLLKKAGLKPPIAVQLYDDLKKEGIDLGDCPLTEEELVEKICQFN
ncbi:energy-coupling factor transporter ATPase [Fundicoccus culcitae]|uniref:Energy-coupling factor transporter ATPase n=1 Tax=Fundicoccus culcitae TaxID=2969821 RepID=A0ABY5P7M2_9LACT|nr:energy-coupling factor transporter ATPase [Fundicoccus culcitae]UUX34732.1 energy-coupling factor transporter ATPase [Fundicoccus culcitae]